MRTYKYGPTLLYGKPHLVLHVRNFPNGYQGWRIEVVPKPQGRLGYTSWQNTSGQAIKAAQYAYCKV